MARTYECDVFIDPLPENFTPIHVSKTLSDNGVGYDVVIYGNNSLISRNPDLIPLNII